MRKSMSGLLLVGLICLASCAKRPLVSMAGQPVPETPLLIDVSYDSSLDNLVPGYKIIIVVVSNSGYAPFVLDPAEDRWTIVDRKGMRHAAYISLRDQDMNVWAGLSLELRQKLSSPLMVPNGVEQPFDLFLPGEVLLDGFRSLEFQSSQLHRTIRVITSVNAL